MKKQLHRRESLTWFLVALSSALGTFAGCSPAVSSTRDASTSGDSNGDANASDASDEALTWTDDATGLTWQVPTEDAVQLNLAQAEAYCEALAVGGSDDWRLPTIDELRTLIRGCPETETGGLCPETDACTAPNPPCYDDIGCIGCASREGGPGLDGCFWPEEMGTHCGWAWSSSIATDIDGYSCFAEFGSAHLSHNPVGNGLAIRLCVRE